MADAVPAGSLVPVSAGQMRNNWFPARTAEYVTATELKELRQKDASIERDHAFVLEEIKVKGETGPEVLEIAKPKPIEVERISVRASQKHGCGRHWAFRLRLGHRHELHVELALFTSPSGPAMCRRNARRLPRPTKPGRHSY